MVEGWYEDDYFILFADSEIEDATHRYGVSEILPGFRLIGLRTWDDMILRDKTGKTYLMPTVPADIKYLEFFDLPNCANELEPDERFQRKIKWWVKPIAFGGKADDSSNETWLSYEQHPELVKWWNQLYRSINAGR
ncbi:hypothetical protein ACFPT7_01400 [Acidicapsa dinghuensis]|uniref:Uncharacterized protein n=1 Tax=Acidicapsa dinghuensis TaxID=2218256 RepID=A0ABW1EAX6_9BACT|nr:hypothetical protein [Acidicapsa dinghuensis]